MPEQIKQASWVHAEVASPHLDRPVPPQIPGPVEPWCVQRPLLLEITDLTLLLRRQANIIETIDQAVLLEGLNIEARQLCAVGGADSLRVDEIEKPSPAACKSCH